MAFKNGLTFYLKDGTPVHPFMIKKVYQPQTGEPTGYYSTLYNDEGITVLFNGTLSDCPDIIAGGNRTIEFSNGYKIVIDKISTPSYGEQLRFTFYDADGAAIQGTGSVFATNPSYTITLGVWELETMVYIM